MKSRLNMPVILYLLKLEDLKLAALMILASLLLSSSLVAFLLGRSFGNPCYIKTC